MINLLKSSYIFNCMGTYCFSVVCQTNRRCRWFYFCFSVTSAALAHSLAAHCEQQEFAVQPENIGRCPANSLICWWGAGSAAGSCPASDFNFTHVRCLASLLVALEILLPPPYLLHHPPLSTHTNTSVWAQLCHLHIPLCPRPPITASSFFFLLCNPRPPSSGRLADALYWHPSLCQ